VPTGAPVAPDLCGPQDKHTSFPTAPAGFDKRIDCRSGLDGIALIADGHPCRLLATVTLPSPP
jgi:hypothetical protein